MESEYLSVTEYAEMVDRHVSVVRRALISGRLPGKKIGSRWVIPADAQFPDDRRVRSGKYIKRA